MSSYGTVKSFNGNKGYGFITHAEDGSDVFVHQSDCGSAAPVQGDEVTFDVEESPSKPGTYVAKNVTGCTGVPEFQKGGGKGQGTGKFTGPVKSFSELKAWGFITHEGGDIFFHLKDMVDGSVPDRGDQVRYDVEESPHKPGTMKATNVSGGSKGKGQGKGNYGQKGKSDYGGKGYGGKDAWGGEDAWGGKGGYGAAPAWSTDSWSAGGWGPYGGGGGALGPSRGGWGGDPWGGNGKGKGKDAWGGKGGW